MVYKKANILAFIFLSQTIIRRNILNRKLLEFDLENSAFGNLATSKILHQSHLPLILLHLQLAGDRKIDREARLYELKISRLKAMKQQTARSLTLGSIGPPITLVAAKKNENEEPAGEKVSLKKCFNFTGLN